MAPTTRAQSAKSQSPTRTDTENSESKINTATISLPSTLSQLSSLDPFLLSQSKPSSTPVTTLPAEEVNKLHTLARTASPTVLKNTITFSCTGRGTESDSLLSKMGVLPAGVLLLAIDPDTGNSLLHSAISARRVDNADQLMGFFGPQVGHDGDRPTLGRNVAIRKLLGHVNGKRETILHVAVRTGDIATVVGAYRVFCHQDVADLLNSEDRKEEKDYEDMGPENDMDAGADGLSYKMDDIDETTWDGWEGAAEWVEKLLFVVTRDVEGKTAENVARELGHDKIALWLGRLAGKLDPRRRRESQVEIERMVRYMRWANYEDEDGSERNRREEEALRRFSERRGEQGRASG